MAYIRFLSLLGFFLSMSLLKAQNIDSLKIKFPRVQQAALNTQSALEELCKDQGLSFPPKHLFFRAFKEEKILEVWGNESSDWKLIKKYPICFVPGKLGPKIKQGDKQVPEGWYKIDSINPESDFHLSLRINYPNQADSIRSQNELDPGGDIFIHGDCFSVGCIPIEDAPMEEVFWLVIQNLNTNLIQNIPVLILPFDLMDEQKYQKHVSNLPKFQPLWEQLKSIQLYFDDLSQIPEIFVSEQGEYLINY
ncbi:MAG TPA: L,D-transpeptidase family protein [Chitinophagales bacterium]|nr:L,D-transpeptidase family protein [Chitinophagales bacterium]